MRIPLFFILLLTAQFAQARSYIDGHLHYVDFFQESEGMQALLSAMDKGNISHAAIMGIPVAKKWQEDEPKKPRYYAATMLICIGTAPLTFTCYMPYNN